MSIGELKQKSKMDMKNNYGFAILATILLNLVLLGSLTLGLGLGLLFTLGAVQCCYAAYYVDIANHTSQGVNSIYRGFRQFARALLAYIILFAITLAVLLAAAIVSVIALAVTHADFSMTGTIMGIFAIIGLIAAALILVRYSFTFYIMNHEVDLPATQCLKKSWQMTKGLFWKIVFFHLSFIGWFLLVVITLGAMSLYVSPYYQTAKANFYLSLCDKKTALPETQSAQA